MRKICIFLASSIDEFKAERDQLQCFINDIAEDFRDRYDVDIVVRRCEQVDPHYVKGRSQDEFNELIRNSEMCIFLFFTKAGEYTKEEFEVARKAYEASENGRPKIYTYFKTVDGSTVEKSVTDFITELDKSLEHFYGQFEHIDTVKLRVLLNLKIQELDFISVEFDEGKCLVSGKEVPDLDISKVSEFANNTLLKDLKTELEKIEKEYFELKPKYTLGSADEATCRKYADVATKRQNLIDQIEELQKSIFNISLRMCEDEAHGEITQRQKEAYRLFEQGDLDGANAILDFDEIVNDYQHRKEMRKREQIKDTTVFIRESATKIEVLSAMTNYKDRFKDIENIYETILPEILEYEIELNTLYDYASYLHNQGDKKAYNVVVKLIKICNDCDTRADEDRGKYYNLAGMICDSLCGKAKEAKQYYLDAIRIGKELAKENPDRYNADLAGRYNNTGIFYDAQGQPDKAEQYYLDAIRIRKELAKENPDRYNADLAMSYNNAGVFYKDQRQPDKAEQYYLDAIRIGKELAKENPDRYNADLTMSYNNAGLFYDAQGQPDKAEQYYLDAIRIRKELAKENPDRYNADLAMSYNNAGVFYKDQRQPDKAEQYYLDAIRIRKELAKENPDRYNAYLAGSYNNAGVFYEDQGQPDKAEQYYLDAIRIGKELAKENPDRYNADLAMSYHNAGLFYKDQGQPDKAEQYYLDAIRIYEELAKEKSNRYNADLAVDYFNYGIFKDDNSYFKKAYELALTNPTNPYCRQIIDMLKDKFE